MNLLVIEKIKEFKADPYNSVFKMLPPVYLGKPTDISDYKEVLEYLALNCADRLNNIHVRSQLRESNSWQTKTSEVYDIFIEFWFDLNPLTTIEVEYLAQFSVGRNHRRVTIYI